MRKAFFPISLQPNSNWQSLAVATIQSLDPMMNERPQERRALSLSLSLLMQPSGQRQQKYCSLRLPYL